MTGPATPPGSLPARPLVHGPDCSKPYVVNDCECGANRHCRGCLYGAGQTPCACRPAPKVGNRA